MPDPAYPPGLPLVPACLFFLVFFSGELPTRRLLCVTERKTLKLLCVLNAYRYWVDNERIWWDEGVETVLERTSAARVRSPAAALCIDLPGVFEG